MPSGHDGANEHDVREEERSEDVLWAVNGSVAWITSTGRTPGTR